MRSQAVGEKERHPDKP